MNIDQASKEVANNIQSNNKGKEIILEESGRKGKKAAGRGRGKAKVIATGYKTTQKGDWLKRGGEMVDELQIGVNRPKKTREEERGDFKGRA